MAAVIGAAEHYHCATVDDDRLGLHVDHHRRWLARDAAEGWWQTIMREVRWYRVKYKSHRFQNECETPCWTTFYGGSAEFSPFLPVPAWLQPLVADVSERCGGAPFNAMLLRLYFDGADEIAWHTDGRTFLGDAPTIASLSLGATAQFQMRRMTNVWQRRRHRPLRRAQRLRGGRWGPARDARRHAEALAPPSAEGEGTPATDQC